MSVQHNQDRNDADWQENTLMSLTSDRIDPTVVIRGQVKIAANVAIGPYSVLTGPLIIDQHCRVGAHCVIGGDPEHRQLPPRGAIHIGTRTCLRDGCVIHHGTTEAGTRIGQNCYIMSRVYIAHDCQLSEDVTLSAGVSLGGHVHIHRGANIGLNSSVHQRSTIGAYAMIGMSTPVTRDVPPLSMAAGNPVRLLRANQMAVERLGLSISHDFSRDGLVYPADNSTVYTWIDQFLRESQRERLFELSLSELMNATDHALANRVAELSAETISADPPVENKPEALMNTVPRKPK